MIYTDYCYISLAWPFPPLLSLLQALQELLPPDVLVDLADLDVVLVHVLQLRVVGRLLHLAQLLEKVFVHLAELLSLLNYPLADVHLGPPQRGPGRLLGEAVHLPLLVDEVPLLGPCLT